MSQNGDSDVSNDTDGIRKAVKESKLKPAKVKRIRDSDKFLIVPESDGPGVVKDEKTGKFSFKPKTINPVE